MNDRLEIASRLMAGRRNDPKVALRNADTLIAEEVRTRPPAPDDLRAVAEELTRAVMAAQAKLDPTLTGEAYRTELRRLGCDDNDLYRDFADRTLTAARARAMGLGGGR